MCALAEARCPLQVLTLQYSGDSNFNPSTSGQNGSPGGPTLLVVSLTPLLQSVTLPSRSIKLYGVRLPSHVTSHSAQVCVQVAGTGTTVTETVVPTNPAANAPMNVSGKIYPSDGSNPVGTITIVVSLPPRHALQCC